MQRIIRHVEKVREQPHHIRKQVAFGAAGAITGLIALVWVGISLSMGAFAIEGSDFAKSTGQSTDGLTTSAPGNTNLAGAAAALESEEASEIEVVPTSTPTTTKPTVEPTTIPF
jgi:hypothetical protein